jgi:hypothetical protein
MGTCEQAVPADGLVTSLAEHTLDGLQQGWSCQAGRQIPAGMTSTLHRSTAALCQDYAKCPRNRDRRGAGWGLLSLMKFESVSFIRTSYL